MRALRKMRRGSGVASHIDAYPQGSRARRPAGTLRVTTPTGVGCAGAHRDRQAAIDQREVGGARGSELSGDGGVGASPNGRAGATTRSLRVTARTAGCGGLSSPAAAARQTTQAEV